MTVEQLLPLVWETGFRWLSVTELLMSDTSWQSLLVAVPQAWRHLAAATEPHAARLESGVLHVPFDLRTTRELRLNFSPEDPGA